MIRSLVFYLAGLASLGLAVAQPVAAQEAADSAAAGSADRASAVLTAYLDRTTSLSATFRSLVLDERREVLAQSTGTLAIKRPGRFRFEETAPDPELLVTDGKRMWNYTPDLEQVAVREVAALDRSTPAHLLGGGADLERDFEVVGGYTAGELEWVDVRPKANTSDFDIVRFGFDRAAATTQLKMMELHSKLGNITQYVLDDVAHNPTLDDKMFVFEPPPGTDVVDGS